MIDFPTMIILGQVIAGALGSNMWSLIVCYVLESQKSLVCRSFNPLHPNISMHILHTILWKEEFL